MAAYIIRYLSLLAPGGLGVREGILLYFMAPLVEPGEGVLISAGSRLWFILGGLLSSIIAIGVYKRYEWNNLKDSAQANLT